MAQIILSDGRRLAYEECGDPKGRPIFYFHGWPSSRLGSRKLSEVASSCHVRLISPDRPGFGLSDFKANRKLLDWPDDVVQLADALKISTFSILGASGGGPYAAVCGYRIPLRINKLGIVVGLAPANIPGIFTGMAFLNHISWQLLTKIRLFAYLGAWTNLIQVRYFPGLMKFGWGSKYDQENVAKFNKEFRQSILEAFRQGVNGPYQDLVIYSNPWGFSVSDIKVKTLLWYGGMDKNVSLAMGNYYASHISGSKLTVYPNEGHTLYLKHSTEILSALAQS